jgi:hypothetical protein
MIHQSVHFTPAPLRGKKGRACVGSHPFGLVPARGNTGRYLHMHDTFNRTRCPEVENFSDQRELGQPNRPLTGTDVLEGFLGGAKLIFEVHAKISEAL